MEHRVWEDILKVLCLLWKYSSDKKGVSASFTLLSGTDINILIKVDGNGYDATIWVDDKEVYCRWFETPKEAAIDVKDTLKTMVNNIVSVL